MAAHIFDNEVGHFVSEEHRHVAEIIRMYDQDLELVWIPPDKRDTMHELAYPFAIRHSPGNQPPYIVRYLQDHEINVDLLADVFMSDTARHGIDIAGRLEAKNKAIKALQLAKDRDQMRENHEIAASILASPLNTYKHDGVTYR